MRGLTGLAWGIILLGNCTPGPAMLSHPVVSSGRLTVGCLASSWMSFRVGNPRQGSDLWQGETSCLRVEDSGLNDCKLCGKVHAVFDRSSFDHTRPILSKIMRLIVRVGDGKFASQPGWRPESEHIPGKSIENRYWNLSEGPSRQSNCKSKTRTPGRCALYFLCCQPILAGVGRLRGGGRVNKLVEKAKAQDKAIKTIKKVRKARYKAGTKGYKPFTGPKLYALGGRSKTSDLATVQVVALHFLSPRIAKD